MQSGRVRGTFNVTWLNYWTSSINFARDLATTSVSLTRGGPLMARGPGWTINVSVGNRATSRTRITGSGSCRTNDDGASVKSVSGTFSMRPGPRWSFSVSPYYDRVTEPQQYVSTLPGGRPETYDTRYVFAFIDRSTMSMEYRLGLTLKPDVNLDVYAEPFAASGRYYDYGELLEPGSRERLKYGTSGTHPHGQPRRQPGGDRRRLDASRCAIAISIRCRSAATWCCAGSGAPAARSTWCGSRIAPAPRASARASASAMRFDR